MPRSSGTYMAPSSSVNPAVEGTVIDETDFNALVDDIESALTESVYTSGVGSTDNRLVRVDGTDTKKVQGSAATLDDSGNLSGIVNLSATGYIDVTEMAAPGNPAANVGRLYVADDSGTTKIYFVDSAGTTTNLLAPAATISDGDKGDITTSSSGATWTIDNGAVTYAKLQDVSATSRVIGRKTSGAGDAEELTASEVLDFISSTQGEILYRGASAWSGLGVGTSGQVLQSQGAGAAPQWATVAGTGDVTAAASITDNRIVRGDGGAKGVQESLVAIDDSGNVTGVASLDVGNADTTLTRSGAGDIAVEGNVVYRAGGTDVALADGGTGASLTDPNADRILFWDDSAGAVTWLEAGSGLTISGTTISASGSGGGSDGLDIYNLNIVASVATNALTVAIKTVAGSDPSGGDPITLSFRSPTETSGATSSLSLTSALSLTISSGSTLGASANTPFPVWVVIFNDGGTARLGLINTLNGTDIFPLGAYGVASSTAEGGAGAADSAHTFYTGTAVTSKAYVVVGRLEWNAGLSAPGTWASAPTRVQVKDGALRLPGQVVAIAENGTTSMTTSTTTIPADDTIPQSTEGAQFFSQAITPASTCHVLRHTALMNGSLSAGSNALVIALFQDSTANALASSWQNGVAAAAFFATSFGYAALAATTSATTFKLRAGPITASTYTINGVGGSRFMGGTAYSFYQITEIAT